MEGKTEYEIGIFSEAKLIKFYSREIKLKVVCVYKFSKL